MAQHEKISLNQVSWEDLIRVSGFGPTLVHVILRYREQYGRFRYLNELDRIQGLTPRQITKLKLQFTI